MSRHSFNPAALRAVLLLLLPTALLSLVLPCRVDAWGAEGHLLVAQIAHDQLTPTSRDQVDELIAVFAEIEPRAAHFVPAAYWLDELKGPKSPTVDGFGTRAFNTWHYINRPYVERPRERYRPAPKEPNVVWAIEQATRTLSSCDARDFETAFLLRVLIHTVGDVHQPLHAIERHSPSQPGGDQGGNEFPLTGVVTDSGWRVDNLHALWDWGFGALGEVDANTWQQDLKARSALRARAKSLVERYPEAELASQLAVTEANAWAMESYRLAVDEVYHGIDEGGRPSQAYRARGAEVVRDRATLAGLRLARLLEQLMTLRRSCS